jgi:hypothetical protein
MGASLSMAEILAKLEARIVRGPRLRVILTRYPPLGTAGVLAGPLARANATSSHRARWPLAAGSLLRGPPFSCQDAVGVNTASRGDRHVHDRS